MNRMRESSPRYELRRRRIATRQNQGTAASCSATETAINETIETPYRKPSAALPKNQNVPYAAVNNPYAEALRFGATIGATAAGMMDS